MDQLSLQHPLDDIDASNVTPDQLGPNEVLLESAFGQKIVMERNPLIQFFPSVSPIGVWKSA